MTEHTSKFLLAVLICLPFSNSAAAASDEHIDRLLDLSGITKQLGELPGVIKAGIEQQHEQARQEGAEIPDALFNAMLNSADRSIVPSEIVSEIRLSLKKNISAEESATLLRWYESDLGKSITAAEERASTPEAYQEILSSAEDLLTNSKRVEFAKRLDKLVGATDMSMDLGRFTGIATCSALGKVMAPDQPVDLDACKSRVSAMEPQIRASTEQLVIISSVYVYQAIDDESLAKYEAFLSNPTTEKFNSAVAKSLNKGLETAISNWTSEMGTILGNEVNKSKARDRGGAMGGRGPEH